MRILSSMKSILSRGLEILDEVEAKAQTKAQIPESILSFSEAMLRLSVEEKKMFCRFFRDLGYLELATLLIKDAVVAEPEPSADADPAPVVLARRESLEQEAAAQQKREAPDRWKAPQPLASLMFPLIPGQGFGPSQTSSCETDRSCQPPAKGASNPKAEPRQTAPAAYLDNSPSNPRRTPGTPTLAGIHQDSGDSGTSRATPARSRRGAWGGASFASRERGGSVTTLRPVPTSSDKNKPPGNGD